MSAILPVMSESSCDNLLLKLFEACNTPLDKTPGFGQLRSIRKSLTPLARKTQFKDRAFQYHVLSRQLLEIDGSTANHTAYESIPSEKTAVQVILALSKLMQEDSGLMLAYHGLRGSGWVIAYARHVLGLPVCVLRSTSKPVPISGDYQSARVLAYLFEQENKCELLSNRNVQDLFVTKSLDPSGHAGWSIDVKTTNVLDSYISAADPFRKGVSVLVRSMANSCIQRLEMYGSAQDNTRAPYVQGLVRYSTYCLPALRKRVMGILSLLGFDSIHGSDLENDEWLEYIRLQEPTREGYQCRKDKLPLPFKPPYLVAGPAWIKSGLGHTQVSSNGQRTESSKDASAQDIRLNQQGIIYFSFLSRIVEAACLLSFTDWDQNLQILSISFLENDTSWRKSLVLDTPLIDFLTKEPSYRMQHLSIIELCKQTIDICIGGRKLWTPDFSDEKMLAFQHHGIIFVQNAAFYQTFNLQSCFLQILPGAINADGEEKMKIYTDSTHRLGIESMTREDREVHEPFTPVDLFPGISFSIRSQTSGESIYLQQDAFVQDEIRAIPSPGDISRSLADLYVTKDCHHRYYDTITATEIEKIPCKLREKLHFKSQEPAVAIGRGLFLGNAPPRPWMLQLWLQAVDQNGPGQWLAY